MLYREVNAAVCRMIGGMSYLSVERFRRRKEISELLRLEFKFIDFCFIHEFLRSNEKLH